MSGTLLNRMLTRVDPLLGAPLFLFERVAVYSEFETRLTTMALLDGEHPSMPAIRAMNMIVASDVLFTK